MSPSYRRYIFGPDGRRLLNFRSPAGGGGLFEAAVLAYNGSRL